MTAKGDYAEITIEVIELQQPMTLSEYTTTSVAQIVEFLSGAKIINSSPVTLGGQPAHQVLYTGQDEDQQVTIKALQIWAIYTDHVYVLTYITNEAIYDRFWDDFQLVLESFTLV